MPIFVVIGGRLTLLKRHCWIRHHPFSFFNVAMMDCQKRPSSDYAAFKAVLKNAQNVAVLTGAGISAESGVPTFRGAGGFWRRYQSQDLASPAAFQQNPSLVWEFYHYRRELVLTKKPNAAHYALVKLESKLNEQNRSLMVITQNVDELHKAAGTKNLSELHGSLFKTRCTKCNEVKENRTSPICSGLAGKGAPDPDEKDERIDEKLLPRCSSCKGLLRPHVVWFGEMLDSKVLRSVEDYLKKCDLCLLIGTSSLVYPAAMFAPQVVARGVNVAEFNIEDTPATFGFHFHFRGLSSETLPKAVDIF